MNIIRTGSCIPIIIFVTAVYEKKLCQIFAISTVKKKALTTCLSWLTSIIKEDPTFKNNLLGFSFLMNTNMHVTFKLILLVKITEIQQKQNAICSIYH